MEKKQALNNINNSRHELFPIDVVFPILLREFGQEHEYYEGLELASKCIRHEIGNMPIRQYFLRNAQVEDGRVELPPGTYHIESVTGPRSNEDWGTRSEIFDLTRTPVGYAVPGVEYHFSQPEQYTDHEVIFGPQRIDGGSYVDFYFDGDCLQVDGATAVNIHCAALTCDQDGYPMLPELSAYAAAAYINRYIIYRDYYARKADINMKREAERDFRIARDRARSIELNENQLDEILNVMTSWNRKRFGLPARLPKWR